MKRLFSLVSVSALVLLSACTPPSNSNDPNGMSSSSHDMNSMSSDAMMDSSASSTTGDTGARIIEMTASDWEFSPSTISVKKGEKVILRIRGSAGVHGFASKDLGIDVTINEGETKDIPIPSDTAGTFEFRCDIPCGPGHMDMKGTITVN